MGREVLRTEREALLAEADADIRAEEAAAADAWDILFCADEDEDDDEDEAEADDED